MENINENVKRMVSLIGAKHGDIKPLVNESEKNKENKKEKVIKFADDIDNMSSKYNYDMLKTIEYFIHDNLTTSDGNKLKELLFDLIKKRES